jgi:putative oxidoreductase
MAVKQKGEPFMKTISAIARYLSGVIFLVFGLNGFLHFIPMPPPDGALAILAPIIVNILSFHALMAPGGLPLALVVAVLWALIFVDVRPAFAGLFHARRSPSHA